MHSQAAVGDEATNLAAAPALDPAQVTRAIRLTYAQMMLVAVFGASTGGMFLIGFAMELGAGDLALGLISSIAQPFVILQFAAAWFIERGVSRKRMTIAFALVAPACWFLVAAIPFLGDSVGSFGKLALLIGVIICVTAANQFSGNARSSWLGELIPESRRGRFFANCTLFAGLIGAAFAIIEGRFLDFVRSNGLFAFTGLFLFGAVFGLIAAALNGPQPDCPLPRHHQDGVRFRSLVLDTFRNRPFMLLALTHAAIALGGIAGPFGSAYALRDVGMSFFGLGLVNAVATAAALLSAPLWGRLVDRVGARPILILGLLLMAPCSLGWLAIPPGAARMAYIVLPLVNLVNGAGGAAMGVAISTMLYKLSNPQGRSVQFAAYSVFVTMFGAPMPLLGGWLITHMQARGWNVDLRLTFYLWACAMLLAAGIARFLHEPGSVRTRTLVFSYFPQWIATVRANATNYWPFFPLPWFARRGNGNGGGQDADRE